MSKITHGDRGMLGCGPRCPHSQLSTLIPPTPSISICPNQAMLGCCDLKPVADLRVRLLAGS